MLRVKHLGIYAEKSVVRTQAIFELLLCSDAYANIHTWHARIGQRAPESMELYQDGRERFVLQVSFVLCCQYPDNRIPCSKHCSPNRPTVK